MGNTNLVGLNAFFRDHPICRHVVTTLLLLRYHAGVIDLPRHGHALGFANLNIPLAGLGPIIAHSHRAGPDFWFAYRDFVLAGNLYLFYFKASDRDLLGDRFRYIDRFAHGPHYSPSARIA